MRQSSLLDVNDDSDYDPNSPVPPVEFPKLPNRFPTDYCCPRCKFEWRGEPKPEAVIDDE